jgi:hypothetical protein
VPGAGVFQQLVWAPGEPIRWDDVNGGIIELAPPAQPAGEMTFAQLQSKVWHLLREPGPDTGDPIPTTGDFPQAVVQRDLNLMLAQFISATGLAPTISDKQVTVGVFPVLDMPLPPDYQSITNIDYTPAGGTTYSLLATSFSEWNAYYSGTTAITGIPERYRQPWAGYVRLWPQPGPGQAFGPGIGTVTFSGIPDAGDTVQITITNSPNAAVVVPTYTVLSSDSLASIAQAVANLIAVSSCCVGGTAFLAVPTVSGASFQLTALVAPGTQISFLTTVVTSDSELSVTPNGLAYLQPNGDTMTFYYSSTGTLMNDPNDSPGIPVQFHVALVYGVLADYWLRKQDPDGLARIFKTRFDEAVGQAKRMEWDSDRATAPTGASFDDSAMDYAGYY